MTDPRELVAELKTLKAFLTKEATDYINFLNSQQMKRTLDYKARGDSTADYRGLSGIEETKYWPFIRIADSAASLIEQQLEGHSILDVP